MRVFLLLYFSFLHHTSAGQEQQTRLVCGWKKDCPSAPLPNCRFWNLRRPVGEQGRKIWRREESEVWILRRLYLYNALKQDCHKSKKPLEKLYSLLKILSGVRKDLTEQVWSIRMGEKGFPGGSVVKNPPANAGDAGLIPFGGESTCCGATKLVHCNCWVCALGPGDCNYWTMCCNCRSTRAQEPVLHSKRSHSNEKPVHHSEGPA